MLLLWLSQPLDVSFSLKSHGLVSHDDGSILATLTLCCVDNTEIDNDFWNATSQGAVVWQSTVKEQLMHRTDRKSASDVIWIRPTMEPRDEYKCSPLTNDSLVQPTRRSAAVRSFTHSLQSARHFALVSHLATFRRSSSCVTTKILCHLQRRSIKWITPGENNLQQQS